MTEIRRLPDADAVAEAAAELLVERVALGAQIALSGGSTPRHAYERAAELVGDWDGARLWLGDERVVPPEDERSNFGMARAAFGEEAPIERVATELGIVAAAGDYEARLREAGGIDLALMGLGPDAHTASLFPGKPALLETRRWVTGVPVAGMEPQVPRVTMTLPLFNAAREVVFLVSGADKAEAVARAWGQTPDAEAPAARVQPASGRLLVLLDEAAAARL